MAHAQRLAELFPNLPAQVTTVEDRRGQGLFLRAAAEPAAARHEFSLGPLAGVRRFTCCYRYDPWWVRPAVGRTGAEVPAQTEYLLAELADGGYAVLLTLVEEPFTCYLQGAPGGEVTLVAETGDPATVGAAVTGLFLAWGPDPYRLVTAAAESVTEYMGTGRLRRDKALPEFVDLFGWCTWDAFYMEVSPERIREGLASFAAGGVSPRFLLLDAGWQTTREQPTGEKRLAAFAATPDKFPGDLRETVAMAKGEYGVDYFLVWHTLQGYWGGTDGSSLPYRVGATPDAFSPGLLQHAPEANTPFYGPILGLVEPEDVHRFYQDYHRHLRRQGVDGVKVDCQGTLDGVAAGRGGAAALARVYHEALEGSAQTHFLGRLINCMSASANVAHHTLSSTLMRSYTDFWPNDPASHGLHLYANAQATMWLGEFIHPDWDMFQSGHPLGAYHAAGRAVAGCPVYVSDKPDGHDFGLLRKLVCSDGTVLRACGLGRPTRDCLFADPTQEAVLLKIFNHNEASGVVGVFNARYHPEAAERTAVAGVVRASDVEGMAGEEFVAYFHTTGELRRCRREDELPVCLPEGGWEIVTFAPVEEAGVAVIGLSNMLNSGGAVLDQGADGPGRYRVLLRDGGQLVAWGATAPSAVQVEGQEAGFSYDPSSGRLEVEVRSQGPCEVGWAWA